MKRALIFMNLLISMMLIGGLFSCVAQDELDTVHGLEDHSPWTYDDGNVLIEVKITNTSINVPFFERTMNKVDLAVGIEVKYSNKQTGLSFTRRTHAGEKYQSFSWIKGHTIVAALHMTGFGQGDIRINYFNWNDATLEFVDATLEIDPITKSWYVSPVPFNEGVYKLRPGK